MAEGKVSYQQQTGPMAFAYADPPYFECCHLYGHRHEEPWGCWDDLRTHGLLIGHLYREFPDGWALSASAPSLMALVPLLPRGVRIAAWVKPFAAFKANVRNAYTWEPVIVYGGRRSSRDGAPVSRDHLTDGEPAPAFRHSITLRKGLTGAKPPAFCEWVLAMLGFKAGDTLADLFPGTGAMGVAAVNA